MGLTVLQKKIMGLTSQIDNTQFVSPFSSIVKSTNKSNEENKKIGHMSI